EDPIAIAYREKKLTRNFQGYALPLAEDLVGLGVSSIGFIGGAFFQNCKTIESYETALKSGQLPVERGYLLSGEDLLRQWVILSLMCHFEVDKAVFARRFGKPFEAHFQK